MRRFAGLLRLYGLCFKLEPGLVWKTRVGRRLSVSPRTACILKSLRSWKSTSAFLMRSSSSSPQRASKCRRLFTSIHNPLSVAVEQAEGASQPVNLLSLAEGQFKEIGEVGSEVAAEQEVAQEADSAQPAQAVEEVTVQPLARPSAPAAVMDLALSHQDVEPSE
eukprot:m.238399 g.238399  ORF g.238399 m.238399 type:complete len:164 (+) comp54353_c0_seq24:232-723(+)